MSVGRYMWPPELFSGDDPQDCCWCRRPLNAPLVATREHLIPRSQGGDNGPDNIAAACQDCNRYRADIDLHEWTGAIDWARAAGIPATHVSPVARYLCGKELRGFKVADKYKVALLDHLISDSPTPSGLSGSSAVAHPPRRAVDAGAGTSPLAPASENAKEQT